MNNQTWEIVQDNLEALETSAMRACMGDRQYYDDMKQEMWVAAAMLAERYTETTSTKSLEDYILSNMFGVLKREYTQQANVVQPPRNAWRSDRDAFTQSQVDNAFAATEEYKETE